MKSYGFMILSGLSGDTIHVSAYLTKGDPQEYFVHLSVYGETIGYTSRTGPREWTPVVFIGPDEVSLTAAHTRMDAIRDMVQHLSDICDPRMDLEWRQRA